GVHVAIATISALPHDLDGDRWLVEALARRGCTAARIAWDARDVEWHEFAAVVIRSTWDYSDRHAEFVAWVDRVGHRLHNAPALVRWNSQKTCLRDLAEAGVPVGPTTNVARGHRLAQRGGEVVAKPSVSAGAKATGRFGQTTHDLARELVGRSNAS